MGLPSVIEEHVACVEHATVRESVVERMDADLRAVMPSLLELFTDAEAAGLPLPSVRVADGVDSKTIRIGMGSFCYKRAKKGRGRRVRLRALAIDPEARHNSGRLLFVTPEMIADGRVRTANPNGSVKYDVPDGHLWLHTATVAERMSFCAQLPGIIEQLTVSRQQETRLMDEVSAGLDAALGMLV